MAAPVLREASRSWVVKGYTDAMGFLFGRRAYELLANYWPNANQEEQEIANPLNSKPKYVASTTLREPLQWKNATLLVGDVPQAVAALKEAGEGELHLVGSPVLAQSLIEADLVDGYRLMRPPCPGRGKRFFTDDGTFRPFALPLVK